MCPTRTNSNPQADVATGLSLGRHENLILGVVTTCRLGEYLTGAFTVRLVRGPFFKEFLSEIVNLGVRLH